MDEETVCIDYRTAREILNVLKWCEGGPIDQEHYLQTLMMLITRNMPVEEWPDFLQLLPEEEDPNANES